ncbi:MAG: hypothetical protein ABTS22_17230 [Accumulibacter sp.]|jgi:hypothetical protein|uniref:hypothetical protein n=1 Tax=Accumulibacter sp. TaxID=2053492 RepID=UPI003314AEA4
MRIPAEVIPPVANLNKEIEGERKTEPVGGAAGLPDEVSASPDGQAPPFAERGKRRQAATSPVVHQQQEPPPQVDRRQAERRSENRPVLLDTRTQRGRRQSSGDQRINIKV